MPRKNTNHDMRPSARDANGLALVDAPWRHKLFDQAADPECFICRAIAASPRNDAKNLLLARGERAIIMLNRYPYTMGALMVAPLQHTGELRDLDDQTLLEMMHLTELGMDVLDRAIHPKGYNLGVNQGIEAGAGLRHHLHQHIVPRWGADTNFMTTVANARVLAEDVDSMYKRLKRALRQVESDREKEKER